MYTYIQTLTNTETKRGGETDETQQTKDLLLIAVRSPKGFLSVQRGGIVCNLSRPVGRTNPNHVNRIRRNRHRWLNQYKVSMVTTAGQMNDLSRMQTASCSLHFLKVKT